MLVCVTVVHVVVTKNNIYGGGFVGPEERARGEIVAISCKCNIIVECMFRTVNIPSYACIDVELHIPSEFLNSDMPQVLHLSLLYACV